MAQKHNAYYCTACDFQHTKWFGCCPSCNAWDTFTEIQPATTRGARGTSSPYQEPELKRLDTQADVSAPRLTTYIAEWDRVTGGGIVPGSFVMLSGDPGIGKSTLLLQIAHALAAHHTTVYISSEESYEQVHKRASRLQCTDHLLFSDEAHLEHIERIITQKQPAVIIVDSIHNCRTRDDASYATTQHLREAAHTLMCLAKQHNVAIIISGHITKEGTAAGPKMLEHMVDAVLYLQGEEQWNTRVLRAMKNRFGATHELGFFEMVESGMQEIADINQHMLADISHSPGAVLTSYAEGSRPILLELQALTIASKHTMPQRIVSGIDHKQVMLIAAIIEKYLQIPLSSHDIFFKVSGGFKITTSSSDLGIALALLSSFFQQPLPEKSLALGEMSLTGHIKPIQHMQQHIAEADKFGMNRIFAAPYNTTQTTSCSPTTLSQTYDLVRIFE